MGKSITEIIVEVLEQAGVKRCYGIVGDTLNLFAENLEDSSILPGNSRQPIQQPVLVAQTNLCR
jgi:thiamine pyrophosphate-dependent acetolactate synthase large subunit-like protein